MRAIFYDQGHIHIRTVIALARKRLDETGRASQPIYHVHVERSDMITVSHGRLPTPHDKTEEFLILDRVKGKWQIRDLSGLKAILTSKPARPANL